MLGTGLPQKRKSKLWIIHSRASHWERTEIILNKIPRYWINTTAAQIPAAEASGYRGCLPQLCVALCLQRGQLQQSRRRSIPASRTSRLLQQAALTSGCERGPLARAEPPERRPHPQARGYSNDTTQTPLTLLRVSSDATNNNFPLH